MHNDSSGQFEGKEYLEAAFSFPTVRFEGTGLLQHGSYVTGCKHTTQENGLVLEVSTKTRMLYHTQTDFRCVRFTNSVLLSLIKKIQLVE